MKKNKLVDCECLTDDHKKALLKLIKMVGGKPLGASPGGYLRWKVLQQNQIDPKQRLTPRPQSDFVP